MNDKEIYYSYANSGIGWIDWVFDKSVFFLNRLFKLLASFRKRGCDSSIVGISDFKSRDFAGDIKIFI